ncbi:hypothetical protein AB0I55_29165 [Actinocatenispora sera]|uniref:hypothetical protein n=1 Tax=Actinocatenispora sera TaxID=390989 RepID=UPI0033FF914A
MGVRVLALASGVTTLEDHRLTLSGLVASAGPLANRGGLLPAAGAADLTTVSAMQCTIAPCRVWVPGRSNALQGGYLLVADSDTTVTVADGEASVDRTDRIAAVVHDDVYDASGQQLGEVAYLRGQPTGQPVAWPDSYVPLYELTVPSGASAATGGVNFAAASDLRASTIAAGGILPVGSRTERDALAEPWPGMAIYRRDWGWVETWDGTAWRVQGTATGSSLSAVQTGITDPYQGQLAVARDVNAIYLYDGAQWALLGDSGWQNVTSQCTTVSGNTLNEVSVRRYGPMAACYAILTIGTAIDVPSSGNTTNTELFKLPPAWWPGPSLNHQQYLGGAGATGSVANFLIDPNDGGVLISATTPGTSLPAGSTINLSGQYVI